MRRLFQHTTPASAVLWLLVGLLIAVPVCSRWLLGWSHPYGYWSDVAMGGLLTALLYRRPRWLVLPVLLVWSVFTLGSAEMIHAVGRMPNWADAAYLLNAEFVSHSTSAGGLSQPGLLWVLLLGMAAIALLPPPTPVAKTSLPNWMAGLMLLLLLAHGRCQSWLPSAADQWLQFSLPHKLLAEAGQFGKSLLVPAKSDGLSPPDVRGLARLDLSGQRLLAGPGQARNVLIVVLEGIPGAYIKGSRQVLGSDYRENPMPRLSQWAERGMLTYDYVLHGHQTIRGLYAMLCGDFDKLNSGTPKGLELLNNAPRSQQCLPAQLRENGLATHFLQGAGLRFMAKNQIMPRMGFDSTQGRDWFSQKPHLEFPWGMDDRSFFEGSLEYVQQLQASGQPWMLTLLTVGTHQPFSAPEDYLARYPSAKQAAVAYLDDAVGDFLDQLEQQNLLQDTLVMVTSDESHGLEDVRLASAWGFNLVLAPEQRRLPSLKKGVYGHVDVTASILDYFAMPVPANISGRSLFRDYDHGREMISYTNGLLRHHNGVDLFEECDFQQVCRRYRSPGFIRNNAEFVGRETERDGLLLAARAKQLDQSLASQHLQYYFSFATPEKIRLKRRINDDWTDNLVGAQYLELAAGTQTEVKIRIRGVHLGERGARFQLKAKEFDREVTLPIPALPRLTGSEPLEIAFSFANPETRKAFSFHLLGKGKGSVVIDEFSITSRPLPQGVAATDNPLEH